VEALLPTLALLACPVGMGLMMFFMARGSRANQADSAPAAERSSTPGDHPMSMEVLREEHRRLGEEIDRLEAPERGRHGPAKQR